MFFFFIIFLCSFIRNPNYNFRPKIVVPVNNLSTNKSALDPNTIYKESYICDVMPQRTIPILPKPNLNLSYGEKVDPKTIYKVTMNKPFKKSFF